MIELSIGQFIGLCFVFFAFGVLTTLSIIISTELKRMSKNLKDMADNIKPKEDK